MENLRLERDVRVDVSYTVIPKQNEIFLSFSYAVDTERFQQWVNSGLCWNAFMDWCSKTQE